MLMTVFPPEQALEFVLLDEYNKGVENEKLKIAKDMKNKKLDYELITELTGLSKEAVEALQINGNNNICIDNGILKDFLEHHQGEVETMLMTVFPPEQ